MSHDMKIDGTGSLGTAHVVHKIEEMPYEGKPVNSIKETSGIDGMKVEGSSADEGKQRE